ncbi:MAG: hypothetical protein IPN86_12485 [Saprospiraceae bacterium]|nr:hypothetical protein [Saprospiraceae bacterium]
MPDSVIGFDNVTAIQAGVLWGYVGLVKEAILRMQTELHIPYKIIATGGLSSILHPLESSFDVVDKMLTLDGMRLIHDYYQNQT